MCLAPSSRWLGVVPMSSPSHLYELLKYGVILSAFEGLFSSRHFASASPVATNMTSTVTPPTALFDPELHYGDGDDNALYNLFATWPESYFSSLPEPHGNCGVNEPYWDLRLSQIFLDDWFHGRGARRLFTPVVPGPDRLERERLRGQTASDDAEQHARKQAKFDNSLALELAQHCSGSAPRQGSPGALNPPLWASPSQQQEEYDEWDGLSDTESSSQATSIPIPNPPIPGPATASVDALQSQVNEFAKQNGFGVVRRNGSGGPAKKTRYVLQCDRYGEPRVPRGAGLRRRRSRKCGCKWKIIAEALEQNDYKWTLRAFADPQHSQHNHGRTMSLSAHPVHRRLTGSVKATIEATSRRVGIGARDVRGIVQEKHRETHYTRRDIYNARALLRREKLGGLSPTAALIKMFDERGVPYIAKWSPTESDRLVGLLWTFPYCLRMWKRFPETISFDNTYNTNRFKLPLFQITGQTCLRSVYNAAFGLIDNERREGFQFLAEAIRELNDRHKIPLPNVVTTDYDQQMKAALESQYPDSQQQICIQHINANVLLNAKRKWKSGNEDAESDWDRSPNTRLSSKDVEAALAVERQESPPNRSNLATPIPHNYRGVLELWKSVAFAETKEEHEKAWVRLCDEFNDQQAILMYLYKTYLPIRAQWAQCFIKKYRNFGIQVTSGTEASHNNVKSYLLNGMSHLYSLVEAIEAMLNDQERDFIDACSQDEVLTSHTYSGPSSEYLGELRTVMSELGLELVTKEHRRALRSIPSRSRPWPEPIGDSDENCSVSWQLGILCWHTIYNKLEAGLHLTKWDVHPRWHLREPTSHNPYRRILDPKIAACLRGRPKNATQPVPESMQVRLASRSREAVGKTRSDRGPSRKSAILGPGKQTGVRQAGCRRQASIRRRRSEWETISDEEKREARPKRRRQISPRQPAIPTPSGPGGYGSKEKREDCIHVRT
ncbi:transposase [Purpureocillium lilacinum]|uniref:Transposase n=1 Tax=Purpureocillium lilacinum TaxID=33203 RepID=A0A179EXV5_PURLI|nr:transposase [Purpureocillium lilacinum]